MKYTHIESALLGYEWLSLAVMVALIVLIPKRLFARVGKTMRRFPAFFFAGFRWKTQTAVAIFVGAILLDVLFAALTHVPEASIHDEFAYQLAGETFAAGRLTNPTPEFGEHFESFHLLIWPSYQAKYHPGQGLALAGGRVLMGADYWGVWLTHALAGVAVFWMLLQYVPHRWASLGAFLFVLSDRLVMFWGQTLWGGAVAAIGGALLFGGFGRIGKRADFAAGLTIGTGAGLLLITRPFEGFLACLVVLIGLIWGTFKGQFNRKQQQLMNSFGLAAVAFLPFLVFSLTYNAAVTGNALRLPYLEWSSQYGFDADGVAAESSKIRQTVLADYQRNYFATQTYRNRWTYPLFKFAYRLRPFYLPSLCFLAILGLHFPSDRRHLFLASAVLIVLTAVLYLPTGGYPHYVAPVAAPIALGVIVGLRRLNHRLRSFRPDAGIVIVVAAIWIGIFRVLFIWPSSPTFAGVSVERMQDEFEQFVLQKGSQGIIFWDTSGKIEGADFVYNGPDPLSQDVFWARSLGASSDQQLVDAFPQRKPYVVSRLSGRLTITEFAKYQISRLEISHQDGPIESSDATNGKASDRATAR